MLITSDYHDYYDSAIGFGGVDKTCVYNRKENIINNNLIDEENTYFTYETKDNVTVNLFIVGFCGKTYVGAEFSSTSTVHKNIFKTYFVYGKDIITELKRHSYLKDTDNKKTVFYYFKRRKPTIQLIELYHNKQNTELFFKIKSPIFYFSLSQKCLDKDATLTINKQLKDIHFYKIFDPFQAYQEIYIFLSGVLGNTEKDTVAISDINRLTAKGFDKKWSFRKQSEKR